MNAARWALAAAAALLPFELRRPVLAAGGLEVTTVELALYLAVAAWAVASARQRREARAGWGAAHAAVAAWAAVQLLAAALAPAAAGASLKFAAREAVGAALFFAAAGLVRTPRDAMPVLAAFAAGAVVSAAAGVLEVTWPAAGAALLPFKTGPSHALGFPRATGTFQYPSIAAMYWETALAVTLGAGARWAGGRRGRIAAVAAAMLVLQQALVLSAGRAAVLVTAALAALLLAVALRARLARLATLAGAAAALLAALVAVDAARRPVLRLRFSVSEAWYAAAYRPERTALALPAGGEALLGMSVRNVGVVPWEHAGPHATGLQAQWGGAGAPASGAGPVTALPRDVAPGEEVALRLPVRAPARPGRYALGWRLVQGTIAWSGPAPAAVEVDVLPGPAAAAPADGGAAGTVAVQRQPTRLELWRAGLQMWRGRALLGVGPDNFRRLYSERLGALALDSRVHANSLYVGALAETGLLGLAAWLAVMAALGAALARAWRRAAAEDRAVVLGLAAGLAAFFVHGLVDVFLAFTPTYAAFWMTAGLGAGLGMGPRSGWK